jgi:hypothetical protein
MPQFARVSGMGLRTVDLCGEYTYTLSTKCDVMLSRKDSGQRPPISACDLRMVCTDPTSPLAQATTKSSWRWVKKVKCRFGIMKMRKMEALYSLQLCGGQYIFRILSGDGWVWKLAIAATTHGKVSWKQERGRKGSYFWLPCLLTCY